jgi:hypothetical protein
MNTEQTVLPPVREPSAEEREAATQFIANSRKVEDGLDAIHDAVSGMLGNFRTLAQGVMAENARLTAKVAELESEIEDIYAK